MSLLGENLSYSTQGRTLLSGVSISLLPGQLHAVIGPNGAGKSTLLKLLSGDLQPSSGSIQLNRRFLREWTPRERAGQRAVLPQSETLRFGFTAEQVVHLGRLTSGQFNPQREQEIVTQALQATDAAHLAQRRYPSLSGGERARVQFARVLAQVWTPSPLGARYLLLDEPTASLDLAHQHTCLATARRFCTQDAGVLTVLHDPNLALAYADQVTLLCCGETIAQGEPQKVLTPENLERVYGVKIELVQTRNGGSRCMVVSA